MQTEYDPKQEPLENIGRALFAIADAIIHLAGDDACGNLRDIALTSEQLKNVAEAIRGNLDPWER